MKKLKAREKQIVRVKDRQNGPTESLIKAEATSMETGTEITKKTKSTVKKIRRNTAGKFYREPLAGSFTFSARRIIEHIAIIPPKPKATVPPKPGMILSK